MALGFHKMSRDPTGTWQVRYRMDDGHKLTHTWGNLEQYATFERFGKALALAREWLAHLASGGTAKSITVTDACAAYVERIRELKGNKAADDLEFRYKR